LAHQRILSGPHLSLAMAFLAGIHVGLKQPGPRVEAKDERNANV
jgi:hypothetical protein